MPINTDEKVALDDAIGAMKPIDSVALARLLYDMLLAAKLSAKNTTGMGFIGCTSLGRLVKDKAPWSNIAAVEGAVKAHIRLPLIQSCDTVFKASIATTLKNLPEEHQQTLAHVFGLMEGDELVSLTRILYETVVHTKFPSQEAQDLFGKLYYSGYTWDELFRDENIRANILLPIVDACNSYLRENLSSIFLVKEPEPAAAPEAPAGVSQEQIDAANRELAGALDAAEQQPTQGEGNAPHPQDPMPLPVFASPEEIKAREERDAKIPFRDGKKKKKASEQDAEAAQEAAGEPEAASETDDTAQAEAPTEATAAPENDGGDDAPGDTEAEGDGEADSANPDAAESAPKDEEPEQQETQA